jgi:hypothetical protein
MTRFMRQRRRRRWLQEKAYPGGVTGAASQAKAAKAKCKHACC